jgi:hypothetical protein
MMRFCASAPPPVTNHRNSADGTSFRFTQTSEAP